MRVFARTVYTYFSAYARELLISLFLLKSVRNTIRTNRAHLYYNIRPAAVHLRAHAGIFNVILLQYKYDIVEKQRYKSLLALITLHANT